MNPEIWWYMSRASGIVAWLMLTAAVLWGIVLASGLLPARRAAWLLDLHRWLGGLALSFLAVHLVTLLVDSYVQFSLLDVLLPFASEWRPFAVAPGVIALWLFVAVMATSLAMRRLPKKWWRAVHLASYAVFWLTSIHGALAGTDATQPLYIVTSIVALAAVVFTASYRILTRNLPRRRRERRPLPSSANTSL